MDRNALRSAALGRKFLFPSELVTHDGTVYEVRAPTVAARSRIVSAGEVEIKGGSAKFDQARMLAHAVVECVFVPLLDVEKNAPTTGGTEKVFSVEDVPTLLETPPGGIVDVLGTVALRLMNVAAGSEGTGGGKG